MSNPYNSRVIRERIVETRTGPRTLTVSRIQTTHCKYRPRYSSRSWYRVAWILSVDQEPVDQFKTRRAALRSLDRKEDDIHRYDAESVFIGMTGRKPDGRDDDRAIEMIIASGR